ncbi:MAG: hypothetical protein ACTH0H_05765 [Brachybacterium sp.]
MWDDDRDGRREHQGLARAVDVSGAPDGRIWNGCAWQERDSWGETGLVTFPLRAGGPTALRGECQCVWHGPVRPLDANPATTAAAVQADWEEHIATVTAAMYPVDVADEMGDLMSRLYELTQEQPLAALTALRELEQKIEPLRTVTVAHARHLSLSWQTVADALGVAKQSAWEKYQFAGTGADVDAAYARAAPPAEDPTGDDLFGRLARAGRKPHPADADGRRSWLPTHHARDLSPHHVGARVHVAEGAVPSDWSHLGEVEEIKDKAVVVRLDSGQLRELPDDEVTPAP